MGIIYIGSGFIRYEKATVNATRVKTVGPPYSGKLNEGMGWEGNGETLNVRVSEALCLGYLQITDRLLLLRHCVYLRTFTDNRYTLTSLPNHSFTLDFVVLNESLAVIKRCEEIIKDWLKGIGLELKPEKTRIAHTLHPHLSEDGKPGFDFLGHHIQQVKVGKYRDNKSRQGTHLGFITLITPSKKAIETHKQHMKSIITKHRSHSQAELIKDLNPVIRGWASYYRVSDAGTTRDFARLDRITYYYALSALAKNVVARK